MTAALTEGLLKTALDGECPVEFLLGLQSGGFVNDAGELTNQGKKSVDRMILTKRAADKQAKYAAGRRERYPSTLRDRNGRRKQPSEVVL